MNYRYIIDEQGDVVPCPDLMTWARWFESHTRRVAYVELPNGIEVSTIFLGLDFSGGAKPQLFETMVFFGSREALDQRRWPNWEEAAAGHLRLVEQYAARTAGE